MGKTTGKGDDFTVLHTIASVYWENNTSNEAEKPDQCEIFAAKTAMKNGILSVYREDKPTQPPVFSTDPADYIGPILSV